MSFGVVERSFERKLRVVQRLYVSFERLVPIDDSFLLASETLDFLFVSVPDQRFVVVANGWLGPRDIVCIE